ncbi:MAG TPA: hypothetical protein VGR45_16585 [Stellaceae bacterium]|nr:hypothetical protein [Stellaceae bacterium]
MQGPTIYDAQRAYIRAAMAALGIGKYAPFAKRIGVDPATISRKFNPNAKETLCEAQTLAAIARASGVPIPQDLLPIAQTESPGRVDGHAGGPADALSIASEAVTGNARIGARIRQIEKYLLEHQELTEEAKRAVAQALAQDTGNPPVSQ